MSSFVPGHFDDYPPPMGEEPSHLERHQDPRQTNLVISEMLQVALNNSEPDSLRDTLPALGEEPSYQEHAQDPGEIHPSGVQQVVITTIRATDLTLGLRRIPAGFHVVVKADSAECQTSNKPVHVDQAVVEWNERILLPCEPSSKVRVVIIFQPKQQEVASPCTSLFMTVEQRLFDENDATVLCPLASLMSSDMDALILRTDAGHGLLARYRRTQNSRDLDQSINHFERASDLCPIDRPYRPAALFNLATAKYVSCQVNRRYLDVDIPITLFEDALDLHPTGHPDRTITQLYLAISLLSRFSYRGFQTDADAAEELLSKVLDVCHANSHIHRAALLAIETSALHPAGSIDANDFGQEWPAKSMLPLSPNQLVDRVNWCLERDDPHALDEVISLHYDALGYYNTMHACRWQLLCNLCVMLLTRFERRGNDEDLNQGIALQREALGLCPVGHTDRYMPLDGLATQLSKRFKHRGNDGDLDEAIALYREALALLPVGHTDRSWSLNNLANQLSINFHHRGHDGDLDEAIALHREALALLPVGHTDRSGSLNNLANKLSTRFDLRGNDGDLDGSIALQREALGLCPVGHTDRTMLLNNLANKLSTRFHHRGNDGDSDEAIALHREVLALRPVGHTDRFGSLNNLANQLSTNFHHRGHDGDLNEAIALQREALTLLPVGHTDWSMLLNNLANKLSTYFHHRGNDRDLDEAIALQREALALSPVGHTDQAMSLNNLANQLSTRFRHQGNDGYLDEAIALQREALGLCPVGHTNRSMSLNNLANELSTRFDHRGNDGDLDEAIALHREALALRPVGHAYRSTSLNNLAAQLSTCFHHRGNDGDLDEAIALQRQALALRPVGHTDRSISLNDLGNRLSTRFDHQGNDGDLDEAITLQREALALRTVGHTDRPMSLHNLANQLSTRFHHRGNDGDLNEAIALQREALALFPVGHTGRSAALNNLGNQLFTHFDHRGNDGYLDEAIALQREALGWLPAGHTSRSISLDNLANQLCTRFDHRGNDRDLDEAIALQREALTLCPIGHTHRPMSLKSLANHLSTRFDLLHNGEDLDEARDNLRCALTLLRQSDPHQLKVHVSLASIYLSFHHSGLDGTSPGEDTDSFNAVMHHLKAAANVVSGNLLSRLRAGLHWVRYASQYSHGTELEAYATSMHLLDAYMSATASVSSRHSAMKDLPRTLAVDAATCALHSGDVRRAVELLEQGRTLIWTQMARLRTPLDSLQTCGDHAVTLMKRFRDLSSLLQKPPASHADETPSIDVEAEETRYRRLVEDWNRAVEEIRKLDGFSRFLLPPLFSDLQDVARDGPIIMLIASKSSCNAIIISHTQPPTSIQLTTSLEKLQALVAKFQRTSEAVLKNALTELWDNVVRPVVENLGGFAQQGSRIWWCPTSVFNFLPLHAAGEYYREHGRFLSRFYISSYTPSLTALIRARKSHDRSLPVPFAAIGQNHPDGASFTLNGVEPELELVRSLLPLAPDPPTLPTVAFTKITSADATKSRALCMLRGNTWLHFACHGTQNYEEPFKSAFLMRDQPLSLHDITQMDLSHHSFAFLSACDTAVGDQSTPDEVIHLVAGLQFVGIKSVIGTLWQVNDSTVQRLVEAFYKNLCGDGKMNSKRAARALHRAVQSLASDKNIPLEQRIVFIHIGI
ncbi:TPR-like protein [Suillus lakei]|nr:TPR-like protein [Suillus lakei]